jgi:hypothetical protein
MRGRVGDGVSATPRSSCPHQRYFATTTDIPVRRYIDAGTRWARRNRRCIGDQSSARNAPSHWAVA